MTICAEIARVAILTTWNLSPQKKTCCEEKELQHKTLGVLHAVAGMNIQSATVKMVGLIGSVKDARMNISVKKDAKKGSKKPPAWPWLRGRANP